MTMPYVYSAINLRLIKRLLPRRPRISGQAFERIKEFGLLMPFRGRKQNRLFSENPCKKIPVRITGRSTEQRPRYVNTSTLIDLSSTRSLKNLVSVTKTTEVSKLRCGLMNCQSITDKKSTYLSNLILSNNYQCMALTETWLNAKEEYNSVVLSSFVPDRYDIFHVPRPTRGGGVGFVYKDHFNARLDTSFEFSSFECMSVILEAGSFSFRFIVVYRVPPSTQNKIQKSSFITDFGDLIEQTSNLSGKLVILGDFNVHVDSRDDAEASQFSDLLDAFGLKQHVSGSTHVRRHTLDLVISRETDDIVLSCEVGTFASDHNVVTFTLRSGNYHPQRKTVCARKIKSINVSNLSNDLQASEAVTLTSLLM